MGRNHFSRAGGPYFINDGFSKHTDHDHKSGHNHNDIKPDSTLFGILAMGFITILVCISIAILAIL